MNEIVLRGVVRDIKPSHITNDTEYYQAEVITQRKDKKEDSVIIKFKKYLNKYNEFEHVELQGNIRSYSEQLPNGKNKVCVYVFTYQDKPEEKDETTNNQFKLDGRICKIEQLRTTSNGKFNIHFIVANNIFSANGQKINNYLPATCWGKLAKQVAEMSVGDKVKLEGELHSRTYSKKNENEEVEFGVAHELLITRLEKIE